MINAKNQHRNSLDSFVKEFFNEFPSAVNKTVREDVLQYPPVNIAQHTENYTVELLAPGYEKADFKIKLEENLLTVAAESKEEALGEGSKMVRKEFSLKSFKRSFNVDDKIDVDNISAKYENGILTLSLPKKEPVKNASKEINVQ